jgi:hypothetical protein
MTLVPASPSSRRASSSQKGAWAPCGLTNDAGFEKMGTCEGEGVKERM